MVTTRKPQAKFGVVSATTITGESVINRDDEKLGKIEELMIDANTGHLAYAVLSFSGNHYAVPWSAFEFANTEKKLILDVDKEKLEAALPHRHRARTRVRRVLAQAAKAFSEGTGTDAFPRLPEEYREVLARLAAEGAESIERELGAEAS